jgi:hypothetical protein
MSKTGQKHIIGWVAFILWMGISVQQSNGAQIKAVPEYGDSVVYYDINAQGELLEKDGGERHGFHIRRG